MPAPNKGYCFALITRIFPFQVEPGGMGVQTEEVSFACRLQPPAPFGLESDGMRSMLTLDISDAPHHRKSMEICLCSFISLPDFCMPTARKRHVSLQGDVGLCGSCRFFLLGRFVNRFILGSIAFCRSVQELWQVYSLFSVRLAYLPKIYISFLLGKRKSAYGFLGVCAPTNNDTIRQSVRVKPRCMNLFDFICFSVLLDFQFG